MSRVGRALIDFAAIAAACVFYSWYVTQPIVTRIVDAAADPAVAGLSVLYSHGSNFIFRKTGVDLGFAHAAPDYDFRERARYAGWANERKAAPLIDAAADKRLSEARREDALTALLSFRSSSDWVQPLLNELPKGGIVGLYEEKTPALDALFARLRQEGGVRDPLSRDYAGLVFSFMLQVPDPLLRSHALRWLSDALPDDALDMILARIPLERDATVQKAVENALLHLRAVPKPDAAAGALLRFYREPPWETLKVPVAVVLSRLGDPVAPSFLKKSLKMGGLSDPEQAGIQIALAGTPYPTHIAMAGVTALATARAKTSRAQIEAAMVKRDRLVRQEKLQRELLARALDPAAPPYVGHRPEVDVPPAMSKSISMTMPIDRAYSVRADAPLYNDPNDRKSTAVLPAGTEAKATAEAMSGGKRWLEVQTPQGGRWVDAGFLTSKKETADVSDTVPDQDAFLEVVDGDVPVYASASPDSELKASLTKGNIVRVVSSIKTAGERWFEIELKGKETGWIRGDLNLKLAGAGENPE